MNNKLIALVKQHQQRARVADSVSTFHYDHHLMLDSLLEHLNGMVYCNLYDQHWTMVFASKGTEELTGYPADALIHNHVVSYEEITHEDDREMVRKHIDDAVNSGKNYEIEYRIRHANGHVIWVLERGSPIYNSKNVVLALEGYIQNISKRKAFEFSLSETEARYRAIFENSIDGIFQTTIDGEYRIVNPALAHIYGYESPSELIQALNNIERQLYVSPVRREEFVLAMKRHGQIRNFESQVFKKNGTKIWISESSRMVFDAKGSFLYYEGTVQDITDLKAAKEALEYSEQSAKQAFEELFHQKYALDKHAIVAITDAKGIITYVNQKFCDISGYAYEELIGKDHRFLNSDQHPKRFFKEMYRDVLKGKTWHNEICNRAKDGSLYWLETTIVPFLGDEDKPQRYISIRTDITKRKNAEEKSHHLAFFDPLTQLPNRRLFVNRLTQMLAASSRSDCNGALLYLDLDHFKTLNDSLGHDIGDKLLRQVAQRLIKCVRQGDTVARIGGDEFVVLLDDLSRHVVEAAAQTEAIGEKILLSLNAPYQLGIHEYQSTPSIGAVLFNDQSQTQDDLLKQADIAMYQAKKSGRNRLSFFDPHMQDAINNRLNLEQELRKAIDQQQFQLHYQIQVGSDSQPIGVEALIRWDHPEKGMIAPLHFIQLAEETGLIISIGLWVLDAACKQLKQWESHQATKNLIVAVNVSAKQFRQPDFTRQVMDTVKKYRINPARLKLELTESLLVDNVNNIITTMNILKNFGIQLSLDDFGTGYSSLQYLKLLPLDQLKIDQSFVRDIAANFSDRAIVLTIITMAKSLGLDVIAEGVETEDQRQFLLNHGCTNYQGYLFSKPLPLNQLYKLLH